MEHATALTPISVRPIDMDVIIAAGQPGTPRRAMVAAALTLASRAFSYSHKGRGPYSYDWVGFVRATVAEVARGFDARLVPLEDFTTYDAGWENGPTLDQATELFLAWGLTQIPVGQAVAGDIVLFAMPRAHAAIMVTGAVGKPGAQIVHTYWGRAMTHAWFEPGGFWHPKAIRAFTWA